MNTQLILSNTLTIKHYQDRYNPDKVILVKKSPAGHYFVNQLISESLAYPKFKRVSGSTLKLILDNSFEVDLMGFRTVMALSVAECWFSTNPVVQYKENLEYRTIAEAKKYYNLGWAYLKAFNDSGLYRDDIKKLYALTNG